MLQTTPALPDAIEVIATDCGGFKGLDADQIDDLCQRINTASGYPWCPMSRSLHVRHLDDDIIHRLKARAARHGRSAEAEHRKILKHALSAEVDPSFADLAARLRAISADRMHTPAETLQYEGRAER